MARRQEPNSEDTTRPAVEKRVGHARRLVQECKLLDYVRRDLTCRAWRLLSDGPDSSESALEEEIIGEEIPHQPPSTSQTSTTGDLTAEALAPLQSMVYLTEDGENMADTMSVVSGEKNEKLKLMSI